MYVYLIVMIGIVAKVVEENCVEIVVKIERIVDYVKENYILTNLLSQLEFTGCHPIYAPLKL